MKLWEPAAAIVEQCTRMRLLLGIALRKPSLRMLRRRSSSMSTAKRRNDPCMTRCDTHGSSTRPGQNKLLSFLPHYKRLSSAHSKRPNGCRRTRRTSQGVGRKTTDRKVATASSARKLPPTFSTGMSENAYQTNSGKKAVRIRLSTPGDAQLYPRPRLPPHRLPRPRHRKMLT